MCVAFLLPLLDVGIVQGPMLNPNPPLYPGCYQATAGPAPSPAPSAPRLLLMGLAWLIALTVAVALACHPASVPGRSG